MTNQTKRAVIYCRVSTKEQVDEGNSLSSQQKVCKDYALKNGYEISEAFIEEGESAKTADRTQLQKLLSYCANKKNNITAVIIYKLDRLSRNTDDYSQLRLLLKRYGVEIKSTSEFFENTPAGRFMENIIANVAQFDNDVRTERSVEGMKNAMREGRYVWMAPFGYSNIKAAGKSNIAPNSTAQVIQKTFEEIAKKIMPIEEVRKMMIKNGLVNKVGKPISRSHFYSLLKNEIYTGWIKKFGERHKGTFKPLISDLLYQHVQEVLQSRKRKNLTYKVQNSDFPLRRFVEHSEGTKLTGGWSQGRKKKYAYYWFNLKGFLFKKDLFEAKFKSFLDKFRLSAKDVELLKQKLKMHLTKKIKINQDYIDKQKKYINELKKKEQTLIQKNIQGVINDQILKEQLALIQNEIFEINSSILNVPSDKVDYSKLVDFTSDFLMHPSKTWAEADYNEKLHLQWFKFPYGVVFNGKEFRTTKICRIFQVKSNFFEPLSCEVPLRDKILNHPEITTFKKRRDRYGNPWPVPNEYYVDDPIYNEIANTLVHQSTLRDKRFRRKINNPAAELTGYSVVK